MELWVNLSSQSPTKVTMSPIVMHIVLCHQTITFFSEFVVKYSLSSPTTKPCRHDIKIWRELTPNVIVGCFQGMRGTFEIAQNESCNLIVSFFLLHIACVYFPFILIFSRFLPFL
jgi:hypothetical protein